MDLSIVIVNYNTRKLVLSCIKSLKSKTSFKAEVIVVDNGSTDGSIETLRKLQKNGEIAFIENKNNLGFSKANNRGIKKAKGRYILLLNSDTEVEPGSIERLYRFAKTKDDAGVVGARLVLPDGTVQKSCFNFPTVVNAVREYWLGQKDAFGNFAPTGKETTEVDAVVGAAFLITPKALKDVGLLDERYFMYFEDMDYCRRIWRSGLKVYYFPESVIKHYHGASGRTVAHSDEQWRRLIPSSKTYHGIVRHNLITLILWTGQKLQRYLH